jgi:hypothetical protein
MNRIMSLAKKSPTNLTLMKSILKSELKKLFSDRDNINKHNNAKFTKLKEFDNSIYDTLLKSRNVLLDLTKNHRGYQDMNMLISLQKDIEKKTNTRNIIIRDIQNEMNYLNNIVKSIREFKKTFIDEIKTIIKENHNDGTITNENLDKLANDMFEDVVQDMFRKKQTSEELDKINSNFKKRYRSSPSISPTKTSKQRSKSPSISPSKLPKQSKKRVKIDESKNMQFKFQNRSPSPK